MYYAWSKEFLEAGQRRLAGGAARAATPANEFKDKTKAPIRGAPFHLSEISSAGAGYICRRSWTTIRVFGAAPNPWRRAPHCRVAAVADQVRK